MNPTDTLTTLYRHNRWANLRLLERCAGLSDEQLDATLLGTLAQFETPCSTLSPPSARTYPASALGSRIAIPKTQRH